jgi:hypothetical protein
LISGTVQRMQYQAVIEPTLAAHRNLRTGTMQTTSFEAQHKPIKNPPVCFAHEGFAVAGTENDEKVYVWDSERGDLLLTVNHGGKYPIFQNSTKKSHLTSQKALKYALWWCVVYGTTKGGLTQLTRPVAPPYRQHF